MNNYFEQKVLLLDEIGYAESEQESWAEIIERLEQCDYLTENFTPTGEGKTIHVLWYWDNHTQIIYDLDREDFLTEEEEQDLIDYLIDNYDED